MAVVRKISLGLGLMEITKWTARTGHVKYGTQRS